MEHKYVALTYKNFKTQQDRIHQTKDRRDSRFSKYHFQRSLGPYIPKNSWQLHRGYSTFCPKKMSKDKDFKKFCDFLL